MDLKPLTPDELLDTAREMRGTLSVADIRIVITSAGQWEVRAVTSRSSRSWLVRHETFRTLPSGSRMLSVGQSGGIMHPFRARKLFPEYAHLEYEAMLVNGEFKVDNTLST